ncbi:MAG: hypothetical protein HUJ54_00525 [Erysipelotrichaceae bacterium]|nr:hypothetical protein [Erysipelotrichaceae bacterium]
MLEIQIKVDGMIGCVSEDFLNSAISDAFELTEVKSNHRLNKLSICAESPIPKDRIQRILDPLGFRVLDYLCLDQKEPEML